MVDTYTPILWATLTEDEKYAEYVRVCQQVNDAALPREPPPPTTQLVSNATQLESGREPPEAAPLEIHAGLVEREGAFWKAVLFFAHESEARRALDLLNQRAARAAAPEEP